MDKLTIINRALFDSGNNILNVLDDGTDEAIGASVAFGRAVEDLISRHGWPFATKTAILQQVSTVDAPSQRFSFGYGLPAEALHLRGVFVNWPGADSVLRPYPERHYEVMGGIVYLGRSDTQVVPGSVAAEYIWAPPDAAWHPQAAEILTIMVTAGCLRGLNEDFVAAAGMDQKAEIRLGEARSRVDQQNPARNIYHSRIRSARHRRLGGY